MLSSCAHAVIVTCINERPPHSWRYLVLAKKENQQQQPNMKSNGKFRETNKQSEVKNKNRYEDLDI